MGARELDRVYERLGLRGWFPLGIFFLCHLVGILRSWMFLGNAMMSWTPDFNCTEEVVVGGGGGGGGGGGVSNASSMASSSSSSSSSSCTCTSGAYTFAVPTSHSFVAEWGVVCDRAPLKYLTETFFYLGCIFACCFMGYLSDAFGRRRVIQGAALFGAAVGLQILWVPHLYAYVAVRFGIGIAYTGMLTTSTYKSELFPAKWRFVAVNCDFSFIYGSLLLPLLSLYVPEWRRLAAILYGLNLVVVLVFFLVPESPTWLIRKGRFDEALAILRTAAAARGEEITEASFAKVVADNDDDSDDDGDDDDDADDKRKDKASEIKALTQYNNNNNNTNNNNNSSNNTNNNNVPEAEALKDKDDDGDDAPAAAAARLRSQQGFRAALRSRVYLLSLLGCGLMWSYNGFVYIGITFSYGTLSGHRLVNFMLNQVVGIPAKAIGIAATHFFRRRPNMMTMYVLIAVLYGVIAVVRVVVVGPSGDLDAALPLLRRVLNIAVLCCVHVIWAPSSLYMQEVFPTMVRGRSYLVACFCGRIVAVAASFFPHLQERHPLALESVVAAIGLCLIVYIAVAIPETFREPLPQTMGDLKGMWERTRGCPSGGCGRRGRRRSEEEAGVRRRRRKRSRNSSTCEAGAEIEL